MTAYVGGVATYVGLAAADVGVAAASLSAGGHGLGGPGGTDHVPTLAVIRAPAAAVEVSA